MTKLKLGVFAHPNRRKYLGLKNGSKSFYQDVYDLLQRWKEYGVSVNERGCWVYRALYEPFEPSPVNRDNRLDKNLTTLKAIISCNPNQCCRRQSYCIDCLANWRYSKVKAIQGAHDTNKDLRLLFRRETLLVPRGLCYENPDSKELTFMQDNPFNPIHEMPAGTKRHRVLNTISLEPEKVGMYKSDPESLSFAYTDMTSFMWKRIGGVDVIFHPYEIDNYNNSTKEKKEIKREKIMEAHNRLNAAIRKAISEPSINPLIPELLIHASRLTKEIRKPEGYTHRITMYPSYKNASVIVLRLDSLFLDTRDTYERLKEESEYWQSNRRYKRIEMTSLKSAHHYYCSRTLTTCRNIPKNIHKLMELLEKRFPFIGNLYQRFLPEEFLFYMNCMSQYRLIRCGGVFQESKCC